MTTQFRVYEGNSGLYAHKLGADGRYHMIGSKKGFANANPWYFYDSADNKAETTAALNACKWHVSCG